MKSGLDLLAIARRAAEHAAEYILSAASAEPPARRAVLDKGHHDWATEMDHDAERIITGVLQGATPEARIVAEEKSPQVQDEGLVWIVDPLDGTTNFVHCYPQYAVSIAAARDGVLLAGVVLDITRGFCYGAVRGRGAWCAGTRLQVFGRHPAGSGPARHRLSLQAAGPPGGISEPVPPAPSGHQRDPAPRLSCARPGRCGAGPARWLLGADAGPVGHGRGPAPGAGNSRHAGPQRVENDPDVDALLDQRADRRKEVAERSHQHGRSTQAEPHRDALSGDPHGPASDLDRLGHPVQPTARTQSWRRRSGMCPPLSTCEPTRCSADSARIPGIERSCDGLESSLEAVWHFPHRWVKSAGRTESTEQPGPTHQVQRIGRLARCPSRPSNRARTLWAQFGGEEPVDLAPHGGIGAADGLEAGVSRCLVEGGNVIEDGQDGDPPCRIGTGHGRLVSSRESPPK
jgi:hypothetical protein